MHRDNAASMLQHMRLVTDGSCVGQFRWPPKFGSDAASAGLQLPETAAGWSKLAAVHASSAGSKCDGPRSAQMGAAGREAGQQAAG